MSGNEQREKNQQKKENTPYVRQVVSRATYVDLFCYYTMILQTSTRRRNTERNKYITRLNTRCGLFIKF